MKLILSTKSESRRQQRTCEFHTESFTIPRRSRAGSENRGASRVGGMKTANQENFSQQKLMFRMKTEIFPDRQEFWTLLPSDRPCKKNKGISKSWKKRILKSKTRTSSKEHGGPVMLEIISCLRITVPAHLSHDTELQSTAIRWAHTLHLGFPIYPNSSTVIKRCFPSEYLKFFFLFWGIPTLNSLFLTLCKSIGYKNIYLFVFPFVV